MFNTTGWFTRAIGLTIAVVLGLSLGLFSVPVAASAAVYSTSICRSIDHHDVCILTIKRSAKNFWEFNAAVSIDGKRGPKEPYNCRSHYKTYADGRLERFGKDSIGTLVCRAYRPPMRGMPLELGSDF
jgi:hypothetical protein